MLKPVVLVDKTLANAKPEHSTTNISEIGIEVCKSSQSLL